MGLVEYLTALDEWKQTIRADDICHAHKKVTLLTKLCENPEFELVYREQLYEAKSHLERLKKGNNEDHAFRLQQIILAEKGLLTLEIYESIGERRNLDATKPRLKDYLE